MKITPISQNHLYKKTYDKGSKVAGKYVVVYVLKDLHRKRWLMANPEKKYLNRVGFTVSTKLGGAVTRNRIRRIMRAAYRELDKNFTLRKGMLVVLVARSATIKAKSTEIYSEICDSFEQLGMIIQKTND